MDGILAITWDIAYNEGSLDRDRLQAVSIGMHAYGMKIDSLSSATVVERAVHFVDRNRVLMTQNNELIVDDPTESIQNPR